MKKRPPQTEVCGGRFRTLATLGGDRLSGRSFALATARFSRFATRVPPRLALFIGECSVLIEIELGALSPQRFAACFTRRAALLAIECSISVGIELRTADGATFFHRRACRLPLRLRQLSILIHIEPCTRLATDLRANLRIAELTKSATGKLFTHRGALGAVETAVVIEIEPRLQLFPRFAIERHPATSAAPLSSLVILSDGGIIGGPLLSREARRCEREKSQDGEGEEK